MSFRERGSGPTSPAHANSRRVLHCSSEEVEAELAKIDSMIDVLRSHMRKSGSEGPSESVCLLETENAARATGFYPGNLALLPREGMRTGQERRADTGGVSEPYVVVAERADRARQADAATRQNVT
jgi:hypothetical protein